MPEDNDCHNVCTWVQLTSLLQLSQNLPFDQSTEKVREYARKALSDNTWAAYEYDLAHFYAWGGSIAATPEMVASYIATFAGDLSVSTLTRRLAAINKAHEMQGHTSPTKSETVRLVMRGIRREHNTQQKQASPLLRDDLIAILNHMPDGVRGVRDRAMLMVGFAGALRRSELVGLNVEDVEFVTEGVIITIQKSKTDQEGYGRKIAIPTGRTRNCPVQSLRLWLEHLSDDEAALFRSIRKGGHIQKAGLSDGAVSCMVKEYVVKIDLAPIKYSGHSLRSGFITSAAQLGIPEWRIMRQSGHKSHASMMRYVRDARMFEDHPLEAMF